MDGNSEIIIDEPTGSKCKVDIDEFTELPFELWSNSEKKFDVCGNCISFENTSIKLIEKQSSDTIICSFSDGKGEESIITLRLMTLPKMRLPTVSNWVMLAFKIECDICNQGLYNKFEFEVRRSIEKSLSVLIGETTKNALCEIRKISQNFKINLLPKGSIYTDDYISTRIRIFHNKNIVTRISLG